jgi:DNA-binding transcriptional LysR family regulator
LRDLNDLRCFAQVVRHGGLSAASRAAGEPKSKLSKRVAQLERDLGVRLIERSTRSIQVTEMAAMSSPSARSSPAFELEQDAALYRGQRLAAQR